MVDKVILKGKYIETEDSTRKDLKRSQDFRYSHFCKSKYYDGIHPMSN